MQAVLSKYKLQNVLVILLIFYLLLVRILLIFSYSVDLDGAEFSFVHFAQKIEHFKTLYQNPLQFPFTNCVYNPLYPYLIWFISVVFNFDFYNDIHAIFVIGRSISFAFIFIQIFYVFKLIQLFDDNKTTAYIGVLLYLLLITGHFFAMRPDAMVTTFFSIFVYNTVIQFYYKISKSYWVKNTMVLILMVLLKQDFIVHILLFLAVLFLLKRNKSTFFLLILSFITIAVIYLLLYKTFGLNYIYNTVLFNFQVTSNVLTSYNLLTVILSVFRIFPLLLLCIAAYFKNKNNQPNPALKLFLLLAIFEFTICHLLMFRAGSFINYSYITIFYLVILTPHILYIPINYERKFKYIFNSMLFLYIFAVVVTNVRIHNYTFSQKMYAKNKSEYYKMLSTRNVIQDHLGSSVFFMPNPKYGIFFLKSNMIYGHDFHIDRYIQLLLGIQATSDLIFIDTKNYDKYFENGKVEFILLDKSSKNYKYVQTYFPAYVLCNTIGEYEIYSYSKK